MAYNKELDLDTAEGKHIDNFGEIINIFTGI